MEIKTFVKPSQYEKISTEANGILYYSGKSVPTERISAVFEMAAVMKDLESTVFCVPVIYRHSPLAYSVINEIHRHSNVATHSGVEKIWSHVLKIVKVFLQWKTVSSEITNAINDILLALGNIVSDYENMDALTPNRLNVGNKQ